MDLMDRYSKGCRKPESFKKSKLAMIIGETQNFKLAKKNVSIHARYFLSWFNAPEIVDSLLYLHL